MSGTRGFQPRDRSCSTDDPAWCLCMSTQPAWHGPYLFLFGSAATRRGQTTWSITSNCCSTPTGQIEFRNRTRYWMETGAMSPRTPNIRPNTNGGFGRHNTRRIQIYVEIAKLTGSAGLGLRLRPLNDRVGGALPPLPPPPSPFQLTPRPACAERMRDEMRAAPAPDLRQKARRTGRVRRTGPAWPTGWEQTDD